MVTVREAVKPLTDASEIKLCWCRGSYPFDENEPLMMDAYGDYVVGEIRTGLDAHVYELHIAFQPVKVGNPNGQAD